MLIMYSFSFIFAICRCIKNIGDLWLLLLHQQRPTWKKDRKRKRDYERRRDKDRVEGLEGRNKRGMG